MLWADSPATAWETSNQLVLLALGATVVALTPWTPRSAALLLGVWAAGVAAVCALTLLEALRADDPRLVVRRLPVGPADGLPQRCGCAGRAGLLARTAALLAPADAGRVPCRPAARGHLPLALLPLAPEPRQRHRPRAGDAALSLPRLAATPADGARRAGGRRRGRDSRPDLPRVRDSRDRRAGRRPSSTTPFARHRLRDGWCARRGAWRSWCIERAAAGHAPSGEGTAPRPPPGRGRRCRRRWRRGGSQPARHLLRRRRALGHAELRAGDASADRPAAGRRHRRSAHRLLARVARPVRRGAGDWALAQATSSSATPQRAACPTPSRYPHDVWLRFLGENGAVGLLLLLGFLAIALGAPIAAWRRIDRSSRGIVALCVAMTAYFLVHASFDWLDRLPAIAGPALAVPFIALRLVGTRVQPKEGRSLAWRRVVTARLSSACSR